MIRNGIPFQQSFLSLKIMDGCFFDGFILVWIETLLIELIDRAFKTKWSQYISEIRLKDFKNTKLIIFKHRNLICLAELYILK